MTNNRNQGQQVAPVNSGPPADYGAGVAVNINQGGIIPQSIADVQIVATIMSNSGNAVPAHLHNDLGACFALCLMASAWRMDPFAVANKSYSVNNRIAYEAQLVNAVALMRAPFSHYPVYSYAGSGDGRMCHVSVQLTDGSEIEYQSPPLKKVKKKSPLWVDDPDQQLGYYAIRALVRRHLPHVLLGVYTADELEATRPARLGGNGVARPSGSIKSRLDDLANDAPIDLTPEAKGGTTDQDDGAEDDDSLAMDKDGLPAYIGPPMEELQRLIPHEPQNIDLTNVREVFAYSLGLSAAETGQPRSSMPNDIEAQGDNVVEAWQVGYTVGSEAAA